MAVKNMYRVFGKEMAMAKSNAKNMKKTSRKEEKGKYLKLFSVEIPTPEAPRKAVAKKKIGEEAAAPPLPLPPQVMQYLASQNCAVPVFLAKKDLDESDVDFSLNRLFLPKTQELLGMLNEEERAIMEKSAMEGTLGVTVLGPMGECYRMSLDLCPILNKLALVKDWVRFVNNYHLKAKQGGMADDRNGHSVELWYFRGEDSKLGFAINVPKDNQSSHGDVSAWRRRQQSQIFLHQY